MSNWQDLFEYSEVDNQAERTLFLLPGTGGTAQDLLFLNENLQPSYNLVGLQGNIRENGLPRFFRRLQPGVFDQANIQEESSKLIEFIKQWKDSHLSATAQTAFLGYSNGANMLLASAAIAPEHFPKLVLLHAQLTDENGIPADLSKCKILATQGENDELISVSAQAKLSDFLQKSGADLTVKRYPVGHRLTSDELRDAIDFLQE